MVSYLFPFLPFHRLQQFGNKSDAHKVYLQQLLEHSRQLSQLLEVSQLACYAQIAFVDWEGVSDVSNHISYLNILPFQTLTGDNKLGFTERDAGSPPCTGKHDYEYGGRGGTGSITCESSSESFDLVSEVLGEMTSFAEMLRDPAVRNRRVGSY